MKLINTLLMALSLMMFATSCENGENSDLPNNPTNDCYVGTMKVDQNDGTSYTQADVEVDYEIRDGKLNFVMYKVKFATGMPIKLDMVVEGVTIEATAEDGGYRLSGDGLVPYAMGGPFEKYTITGLKGELNEESITLSFMCGEYPVEYNGVK